MRRVPRASASMFAGVVVGLLFLTAVPSSQTNRAATMHGAPGLSVERDSDGVRMTFPEAAYFDVGFPPEDLTFTIMLTDTAKIREAREIASGVQTDEVSMMGTIVKDCAFYNPDWSYHLDPASIEFIAVAVEVCDAHPRYVEERLEEACGAFLPGCVWCPFSSVVAEEVHTPKRFLPIILN